MIYPNGKKIILKEIVTVEEAIEGEEEKPRPLEIEVLKKCKVMWIGDEVTKYATDDMVYIKDYALDEIMIGEDNYLLSDENSIIYKEDDNT